MQLSVIQNNKLILRESKGGSDVAKFPWKALTH